MAILMEDTRFIEPMNWPSLLRHHRYTHNLKQAALAEDLGVTQALISRWESGRSTPSRPMRERIRRAVKPQPVGAPMIAWQDTIAQHPAIVTVIDENGIGEIVSEGFVREFSVSREDVIGRSFQDLFSGDFKILFDRLTNAGFFQGQVEYAEGVSLLRFRRPDGSTSDLFGHGLHWPRLGKDGKIRWIASGVKISEQEFDRVRHELGGQLEMKLSV
jgi:transcriptional regulator with XRE-family HTH domain